MSKVKNLEGTRFDRLVVGRRVESPDSKHPRYECVCDCGNTKVVRSDSLLSGRTGSCGCLRNEAVSAALKTHGMTRLPDGTDRPEYQAWRNIKQRCYNPKYEHYANYGGRGITMSEEWKKSFEAFYRDMGDRPSPEHSIDRENNEQGYCKENCRWATDVEQANNRRNNRVYEHVGDRLTLLQWCRLLDLNYSRMQYILNKGVAFEDAIEDPKAKENAAKSHHHTHRKLKQAS